MIGFIRIIILRNHFGQSKNQDNRSTTVFHTVSYYSWPIITRGSELILSYDLLKLFPYILGRSSSNCGILDESLILNNPLKVHLQ